MEEREEMAVYRGIAEKMVEVYDFDWENNIRMKEVCICSVEGIISNITNIILVFLTTAALRISQEALIFIATFAAMRFYAGGAHAKNYVRCVSTYLGVLLISIGCARFGATLQDNFINMICGLSLLIAAVFNYKYAARQVHLGERTIGYRKRAGRIFAVVCTIMILFCIFCSYIEIDIVRKGVREVVLIQAFALLAQSIALWIGRSECGEGR